MTTTTKDVGMQEPDSQRGWFLATLYEDSNPFYLVEGETDGHGAVRNQVGGWFQGHSPTPEAALEAAKQRMRDRMARLEKSYLKEKLCLSDQLDKLDELKLSEVEVKKTWSEFRKYKVRTR